MKKVCAWCKNEMGTKPPLDNKAITHTICPDCYDKHFKKGKENGV